MLDLSIKLWELQFADRAPIDLLSTDAEGQTVIDYMSESIAAHAGGDL